MYSSFNNQIYHLLHYIFSFWFLFFILPRWLFISKYDNKFDFWLSGYIKMTFFLIVSGYILVITKLFEVLSILFLFSAIIGFKYNHTTQRKKTMKVRISLLNKLFDVLDGIFKTNSTVVMNRIFSMIRNLSNKIRTNFSWSLLIESFTLFIIFGFTFYVRFYDTFVNAALPLSDSYVTLAWMKYINNRDLFHDGIYPQGFHIYLAYLYKFAAIDALYILRYTGPLNTIMITAGLYIVIRKLTNNVIGGVTAAWFYGILWVFVSWFGMERQAATNSQEFAFVFIFPTVYFFIKYFLSEKKEDLVVGLLSTAIIGFVHSIGFALIGLMMGTMILSSLLTLRNKWKPYKQIIVGGMLTLILSLIPLGLGYLLGKGLNSSSADYLVSRTETYGLTPLTITDFIGIGSILLLTLLQISKKISREDRFIAIFTILTGVSVFTLYYAGGVLTHSVVIESRSADLWGLILPFCIGILVSYLIKNLRGKLGISISLLVMLSLLGATFIYRPSPIIPYKLEYNESIEQYLSISKNYLPQTWLIVSQDEGYSVSLGKGFHMHLGDFLKTYNPESKTLTKFGEGDVDQNLPPHLFIIQEKKIFEVSKTNSIYPLLAPKYKQRAKEYKDLTKWLNLYKEAGNKVKIYFQNQHVIVYQLDIPKNINE